MGIGVRKVPQVSGPFKAPYRAQRELLAGSPLLAGLTAQPIEALAEMSRVRELAADEELFRSGDPIREAHLLFRGSIKRCAPAGKTAAGVIELLAAPGLIAPGELFAGPRHRSTCVALGHCLLVAIDIRRLRQVIRQNDELGWRIIQELARRQCLLEDDASRRLAGLTGTQRALDYLLELAGEGGDIAGETTVLLKASKKDIAARIGMTPESFSRSLRALNDNGIIVVDGRSVHIQQAALFDTAASGSGRRLSFRRKPRDARGAPSRDLAPGALLAACGKLRVLSQRLAVAWGLIASGIAPSRARVRLRQFDAEFERNLGRLAAARLPPALDDHLLAVGKLWPDYRAALTRPAAAAPQLLTLSEKMLAVTDRLIVQASIAANAPGGPTVNVAGRNRMLSQRIGKFFLFAPWCGDETLAPIEASIREFDDNLASLRRNNQYLPELAAQLREVGMQWDKFRNTLLLGPGHAGRAAHIRAAMLEGDRLLRHIDTTVKLYERLVAAA